MPDYTNLTPPQFVWLEFTKCLRLLLVTQPDDRPLDQYLQFRDDVLALVESWDFIQNLWPPPPVPTFPATPTPPMDTTSTQLNDLLLAELRAYRLAMEVAQAQEKASAGEKKWGLRWLSRASTLTSSVKDLKENLPPLVKGGLTLLGELLDLFKGD